jgi:gluconate 2-dehydrogenase gamma chain
MTNRRSALILMAAGVLPGRLARAQHQMQAAQANPAPYQLQFFTPEEHRLLDRLTEMILPAGERSPGASAARVADFMDLVVANSTAEVQSNWRAGLNAFGGAAFLSMAPSAQAAALDRAAQEEKAPVTPYGRFFVELKRMTVHAYYTSEIGLRQELGYLGPQALASFPGCKG